MKSKGKVTAQREWIDSLVKTADEMGIAVFMKKSLQQLMGNDFRRDPLPWRCAKCQR